MGDGSWVKGAAAIFPWAVAIVIILALGVLLRGVQAGQCVESVAEVGIEGACTSGPGPGVPGAWIWGAAGVIAPFHCGYRILRAGRGQ